MLFQSNNIVRLLAMMGLVSMGFGGSIVNAGEAGGRTTYIEYDPKTGSIIAKSCSETSASDCKILTSAGSSSVSSSNTQRITSLDERVTHVESRTQGVEGRIGAVEGRTQGLEGRMGAVEGRTQGLEGRMGNVEGRVSVVEGKTHALEQKMGEAETRISKNELGIQDLASHLGGGASVGEDGHVNAPTYSIVDAGTGASVGHRDVGSAIAAVQSNLNFNAQDDAKHLGGGAFVGVDGRVVAPTYSIMDTSRGVNIAHRDVGSALSALDDNTRTLAQDVAAHLGGGASVGEDGRISAPNYWVTNANTGEVVRHTTVGAALTALNANMGVAAQDTANHLGGGAQVNENGRVTAPVYTIKDLKSGKQIHWRDVGSALNALDQNARFIRKEGFAGTATAMAVAGLGQSFRPGQTSVGLASATYKGQVGYALGASYMTDNAKFVFKGALNHNSQGHLGAVVGATYYFD